MIEVYQLKIVAKEIKPKIERILWIKSTATFFDLHDTIQLLFGLHGYHLFEFYSMRDDAPISDGENDSRLAYRVRLSSEFRKSKKMNYTYDFGDDWEFSITLQKVLPYDKTAVYPFCIDSTGGELREDCGGPYCYNLLSAWCRNKTDESKEALLQQYDESMIEEYEKFNPDEFDRDEINNIIGKKKK